MIKKSTFLRGALAATSLCAALLLTGCQLPIPLPTAPATTTAATTVATETTEVPETTETVPVETEPVPTTLPDGNPEDVTCKGTYSASDVESLSNAHNVVATIGDTQLTNAQLQIYYWMAVNTYRAENHEIAPDWEANLDEQLCELTDETISWQHYFLRSALNTWHTHQAAVKLSENTTYPTEEAYKIIEKKHKENISEETAYLDVLYGYNMDYAIDPQHQAYLNQLDDRMATMAAEAGYESLSDLVKEMAGIGTNAEYLLNYAHLANKGYMFLATTSYRMSVSKSDVTAYYEAHAEEYAADGITNDGSRSVTIRHILVPGDSESSKSTAQNYLAKWQKYPNESYFGELAYQVSADIATNKSGGLYNNLYQGQLTGELNDWCFDPARQPGNTAVVKSDAGYHVVYFQSAAERWYVEAERDLLNQKLCDLITAAQQTYPMTVDYKAISLCNAGTHDLAISMDDMLYPDIAHQRFSEVPLYFQQDYGDAKYGNYTLRTYGCGITTMAMLASYMKDTELTPPYMGQAFGKYCSEKGTAHTMLLEVPIALDFYGIKKTSSWAEAKAALENGHMIITLQHGGFWTSKGHYVLVTGMTEDGQVTVRDSNLYNYGKLAGHKTGSFDLAKIPANASIYWIYEKKVVNVDTCSRCGTSKTVDENPALAMFTTDFHCTKCQNALARKAAYVDLCI